MKLWGSFLRVSPCTVPRTPVPKRQGNGRTGCQRDQDDQADMVCVLTGYFPAEIGAHLPFYQRVGVAVCPNCHKALKFRISEHGWHVFVSFRIFRGHQIQREELVTIFSVGISHNEGAWDPLVFSVLLIDDNGPARRSKIRKFR